MPDVERLRDILAARTSLQWVATAVVAAVVTLLVAVPLAKRALDAREADDRPVTAQTDGIVASSEDTERPVDGSTLTGAPVITFELPDTGATAFRLVDRDGDEVASGVDDIGPVFSMAATPGGFPAAFDTTRLPDGDYTLYVTFTVVEPSSGETSEDFRMANFSIDNRS